MPVSSASTEPTAPPPEGQPAAQAVTADGRDVERQEVTHPDGYPRAMVKGGVRRTVPNAAEETRLRFAGWRLDKESAPERGTFLPAPTTAAAAAEEPPSTDARPVRPRRRP